MSEIFLYNINNWTSDDVESWIRGISPHLSEYLPFDNSACDGRWLLNLTITDLKNVGFHKIGHCIILLDSVRTLIQELHQMNNETLQNVIYKVSCDATSLINYVDKYLRLQESLQHFLQNRVSPFYDETEAYNSKQLYPGQLDEIQSIKMIIVSSVLKLTNSILATLDWLNKPIFASLPELIEMKIGLLDELKKLNRCTQYVVSDKGDQKFADIKGNSNMIRYRTQTFIDSCRDSLYLTPCIIDTVQIHKTENAVFGINVKTIFGNSHIIESIDISSPAYNIGKLEEGDELLEINNQIIIGWCHQSVIEEIRSHPRKLCLRLRKKPMHVNETINSGGRRNRNMPQNPVNAAHIRGGVLTRPSKRINQAGLLGSVSTPATPVLLSKNVHNSVENAELLKQKNEIANEVLRKLALENPNLDNSKGEELGSESEYSAADASPYVSRHKIKNSKEISKKDDLPHHFRKPTIETFTTLSEEDDVKSEFGSGEIYPRKFLANENDSMDELNPSKRKKPQNDDPLNSTASMGLRKTSGKSNSYKELNDDDCEGWLYMKSIERLYPSYSKKWCILQDKVLKVYSNKGGLKDAINIEVCEIISSNGSCTLSFKISNMWMNYSFKAITSTDYFNWFDKLKRSSHPSLRLASICIRTFDRKSATSQSFATGNDPFETSFSTSTGSDVSRLTPDSNNEVYFNREMSVSSYCVVSASNSCVVVGNNLGRQHSLEGRILQLEREIRDKSIFLAKIDHVLKMSHDENNIDIFYEENYTVLMSYS